MYPDDEETDVSTESTELVPRDTGRRLALSERQEIVELKLQGVPVRKIAAQLSCSPTTVTGTWRAYLEEHPETLTLNLEAERLEALSRLERIADDAHAAYETALRSDELSAARAFLSEERNAILSKAKIAGFDTVNVNVSGGIDVNHVVWEEVVVHPSEMGEVVDAELVEPEELEA